MARMKTAISIEESIFKEVKKLAAEMNKSRSELISIALSEFIEKQKSRKLLEEINVAYDDMSDESEIKYQQAMKIKQQKILGQEKW